MTMATKHISSIPTKPSYRHDSNLEDTLDGYTSSVYEESILSDNEDSVVSAMATPELPTKSAMRVTRLLTGLSHKLDTQQRPVLPQAAPHDLYLSSEEDASSSAEDGSEYLFDSDDESSSVSSEHSFHQDTARAVEVVFSGKPSMISLPPRETKPETWSTRRHTHSPGSFAKRISIMTATSSVVSITSPTRPRSTMLASPDKAKPHFLESDPYPSASEYIPKQESMLRKTFKLVKQRSQSRLSHVAARSRDSLLAEYAIRPQSHAEDAELDMQRPKGPHRSYTTSATEAGPSFEEAPVPPPMNNRRRVLSGFGKARIIRA
jgi:hypothetical protein